MAAKPQEYVTPAGRMTTNSLEGFHGMALKYRQKRIDLHHNHYTCKTNMAICHKVTQIYCANLTVMHGSLFRILDHCGKFSVFWEMGVDVPRSAVMTIVKEHLKWQKQRAHRGEPEYPKYR